MLPATTGPAPSSDPPLAATPLTVRKLVCVSKSHTGVPSAVENARMWPSIDPENTRPGTAVTAPGCAGLHPRRGGVHGRLGANQTLLPSTMLSAVNPPPRIGSSSASPIGVGPLTRPTRTTSETDA